VWWVARAGGRGRVPDVGWRRRCVDDGLGSEGDLVGGLGVGVASTWGTCLGVGCVGDGLRVLLVVRVGEAMRGHGRRVRVGRLLLLLLLHVARALVGRQVGIVAHGYWIAGSGGHVSASACWQHVWVGVNERVRVKELTDNKAGPGGQAASNLGHHKGGHGRSADGTRGRGHGCGCGCASGSVMSNGGGPVTLSATALTDRQGGATWGGCWGKGSDGEAVEAEAEAEVEAENNNNDNNDDDSSASDRRAHGRAMLWRKCGGARGMGRRLVVGWSSVGYRLPPAASLVGWAPCSGLDMQRAA
jgi:hypothetical protein